MSSRTRKTGTRQQQFTKAAAAGNLKAQVQIAREAARDLLERNGLDDEAELDQVTMLAGERHTEGEAWLDECRRLKAAYALGIAIGQLIHPDVFKSGGAR